MKITVKPHLMTCMGCFSMEGRVRLLCGCGFNWVVMGWASVEEGWIDNSHHTQSSCVPKVLGQTTVLCICLAQEKHERVCRYLNSMTWQLSPTKTEISSAAFGYFPSSHIHRYRVSSMTIKNESPCTGLRGGRRDLGHLGYQIVRANSPVCTNSPTYTPLKLSPSVTLYY